MEPITLAKALEDYKIQKKLLEPERYEAMSGFRSKLPEVYPKMEMGPGAAPEGGDDAGSPPPMPDFGAMIRDKMMKGAAVQALLRGEMPDNDTMEKAFGFSAEALAQAMQAIDPVKKPIPRGLVLMTFDDSTIDHYQIAAPVLEKYGFKGIFFTTEMEKAMNGSDFSDKTRYMTWEQIKELSDRGHEIANHSWHHGVGLYEATEEEMLKEIRGIDQRCAEYGIPKPISFGYPGGGCSRKLEQVLRNEGYRWGRGDLKDDTASVLEGSAPYDPYLDTPLCVPNVAAMSLEQVKELLDSTENGRVLLMVKHEVTGSDFSPLGFEELIKAIYDNGGRCITFRELEEYIDPEMAYRATHR